MQRRALHFGKNLFTASAGYFGLWFTIHDSCNDFPFALWHIWFSILLSRHRSRRPSRVDLLRHIVGTYLVAFLVSELHFAGHGRNIPHDVTPVTNVVAATMGGASSCP